MSENSIKISGSFIGWVLGLLILLVGLVVGFNILDNSRKFKQFKEMHEVVANSKYPMELSSIISEELTKDSLDMESLHDLLNHMSYENEHFTDATVYIEDSTGYLKVGSYITHGSSNKPVYVHHTKYVSKELESAMEYLDTTSKPQQEVLYNMLNYEGNYMRNVIKLENGYLVVKMYRN